MKQRIHIFGASGSGTTTIAERICSALGYTHFDSDEYFWLKTEKPFTEERPREACLQMMQHDLSTTERWVLSGSLTNWGNVLIPMFDLVVFVYVPLETRLARLRVREYERYGDTILPGGERYENAKEFLNWAATYDQTPKTGRSLEKHEKWLELIECPVLRVINNDLDESVKSVLDAIGK